MLNSGDTIGYAFGQGLGEYRGLRTINHTGSWAGYRTILQRFPDQEFAVIVLSNSAEMNPSQLALRITEIYIGDSMRPVVAAAPPAPAAQQVTTPVPANWTPSETELREFVGDYYSAELETTWSLDVSEARLTMSHFRLGRTGLQPGSRDRFQSPFGEIRFQRDSGGAIVSFTANSDRVRNLRFVRER